MDIKTYIESGILELYVAGALSDLENREVYNAMLKHPEILHEVLNIEAAVVKLTAQVSPSTSKQIYASIKKALGLTDEDTKVMSLNTPSKNTNWLSYTGWAAAVFLAVGLLWTLNKNASLNTKVSTITTDKEFLEIQIEDVHSDLADTKKLLNVVRDENLINITLDGQAVYPEAYAKVYWDKSEATVYLDLEGLPKPPKGKVYQIWSLTLNPLSPTSLGTIDDFNDNTNKIFELQNNNASQAFGITLEPAGGSKTPTMEQLYTLGVVSDT
ncbi:anti-sigma factor [Bizionia saleffrena]|uniref:Anti-sigma factor n=1 Tax=Bizionia saleffrena TaxID=291189 RepID=A0A8H2QK58_9FLAO|nr:anti-sigma factor [Bizionia saleffrena]TYB77459.1 anti-sigma factor [Bizionia saleffrena]